MTDFVNNTMENSSNGEESLAPPVRKNYHTYGDIGNHIHLWAKKLEEIANNDVPKAFPFVQPKGGSEPGYRHMYPEYMGAGFSAEIPDGLYAMSVVNDVLNIFIPAKFAISSLFPPTFDNGRMEIEIPDQFEEAKSNLEKAIEGAKKLQSDLQQKTQQKKFKSINRKEMEKLNNHFVRIGYDFLKHGVIAQELLDKQVDTRPEVIARERAMLKEANILPNMDIVLMDSGSNGTGDGETTVLKRLEEWR